MIMNLMIRNVLKIFSDKDIKKNNILELVVKFSYWVVANVLIYNDMAVEKCK